MRHPQPLHAPGRWAIHAARLFDGGSVQVDQAVLIEDDRVAAVLPATAVPRAVPVWSLPDSTLLPGLIDLHAHFTRWTGPLYLAEGITTVRDVGNDLPYILARRAEAPARGWPRLAIAGPVLDGPAPHWPEMSWGAADVTEACGHVATLAAAGVDAIKLYVRLPEAWIAPMTQAAHAAGLPVMMHCGAVSALAAARAGVDELFHLDGLLDDVWPEAPGGWMERWGHPDFPSDPARQARVADALAATGVTITPTLVVWDFFIRECVPACLPSDDAACLPLPLRQWLAAQAEYPDGRARWERARERLIGFVGLLLERGVRVLPGTDVPFAFASPGVQYWRELRGLTDAGMPALDALRAATTGAARALRMDTVGRIVPGCAATFVCVAGDPTAAIPSRPRITGVVRDGARLTRDDLLAASARDTEAFTSEPLGLALARYFRERAAAG